MEAASSEVALPEAEQHALSEQLLQVFEALAPHGMAFGFRAAKEITRFVALYRDLHPQGGNALEKGWLATALDAQLLQKVLPRLSGSRSQLAEVLAALAEVCETGQTNASPPSGRTLREPRASYGNAHYPQAAAKLVRMWRQLEANGFVSFMEA